MTGLQSKSILQLHQTEKASKIERIVKLEERLSCKKCEVRRIYLTTESLTMHKMCFPLLIVIVARVCLVEASNDKFPLRYKRSDDVPPLQTVVEQQAALLQTLQAKVTVLESETAALKSKQQMLSTPVAFSVRFLTDNRPLTTHSTLMFDYVLYNAGNGYDPTTGLFTAPVSGTYAFFLAAMSSNQHAPIYLSIVKQGNILDEVFAEGTTDNYDQGSTQTVVHVSAGEKVWARQESGDEVRGGAWTVFTGFLLQPE